MSIKKYSGKRKPLLLLLLAIIFLVICLDQITKNWADTRLALGRQVNILGSWLKLKLAYNSGAAFSLGSNNGLFITILAITITLVILFFALKVTSPLWIIALGLIGGGALGNIFDRFTRGQSLADGQVVDFISVKSFPIFNLADSCVTVGSVLIFLLILFNHHPYKPYEDN